MIQDCDIEILASLNIGYDRMQGFAVQPDGVATLGQELIFMELDRGTSSMQVWAKKDRGL